ncbi:MAG TPA: AsmA family protein, partial [Burkholderiales bacterium]|nr:AsmA family protein [Burkholderiales bacterium]
IDFKQNALALVGSLASPMTLDLDAGRIQLAALKGDMRVSGPKIPNKSVKLTLDSSLNLDWNLQKADARINAKLDDSNIKTRVAVNSFDAPVIDFDFEADQLDLDRYHSTPLPEKKTAPSGAVPSGASSGGASSGSAESAPQEDPIQLDALQSFDARGDIKIGNLGVAGLQAQSFNMRVALADGRLNLNPMNARFYGGTLAGNIAVDSHRNAYTIVQNMSGINVGPLLRDLADKDLLEGRGDVSLDVKTVGTTPTALKRALDGNGKLLLKDGALKGVNLAQLFRKAKAAFGSRSAAEEIAQGGEQTDFSDLTASFTLRDGVAHNEDLLMRSPFLRVTGAGDIDIGHSRMDYVAKVSIVDTSTGQGGKDLEKLRGLTAPVHISGPLDALKYRLDAGALAKDALTRELEKRLGGSESTTETAPSGDKKPKRSEKLLRELFKK